MARATISRIATVWLRALFPPIAGILETGELAVVPDTRIVLPVLTARQ